jgi:hypothetical protein
MYMYITERLSGWELFLPCVPYYQGRRTSPRQAARAIVVFGGVQDVGDRGHVFDLHSGFDSMRYLQSNGLCSLLFPFSPVCYLVSILPFSFGAFSFRALYIHAPLVRLFASKDGNPTPPLPP